MSCIVKVRNGYTLQVGRDPNNWVTGPKTIKIKNKALLAGQMRKVEVLQDDGTPTPVIVKAEAPAAGEQGVQDTFWGRGDVEELEAKTKTGSQASEDDYLRRRVKAQEIIEKGNTEIQDKAKARVAAADEFMGRQRAERVTQGYVEVIDEPGVVVTEPAGVSEEEIFRAQPITAGESVEVIGDEEVHEIGADAEQRLEQAVKPVRPAPAPAAPAPPVVAAEGKKVTISGVDPKTVQLALQVATTYDLRKIEQAMTLLEGVEKGLVYVFKPPELRAKLQESAQAAVLKAQETSENLRLTNEGLAERVEALEKELAETNAEAEKLDIELKSSREEVEKMQRNIQDRNMKPPTNRAAKKAATKKAPEKKKPTPKAAAPKAPAEAPKE